MFTPQRRALPALSPGNESNGLRLNARGIEKGKAVAFFDGPPPPLSTLGVNEGEKTMLGLDTGDMKDWRRFREAGLLDEATLESKNLQALVEKLSKLQNELFNYQYSMGLLLMEKKEWTSKNEDIEQELAETEEIIKREHSTHLMLLSEAEKREENMRKALASERQCVADLEKALRCVDEEHTANKLAYEKKLVDTNALVLQLQEKSLVVEENVCAAEAKIEEVNRKSAEIELKIRKIDARQSMLQRERMSLCKEQETWKKNFYKERDELRRWEQNLQDREESLCQSQKIFGDRDKKINENDWLVKQKEMSLEVTEKNIDLSRSSLIAREDDFNKKLADLEVEEKEADSLRSLLEMKQKDLLVLQEKLNRRERVDIEILLDNQRDILLSKEEDFKLQWEDKRRALEKELNERVHGIAQREAEMNHQAEKLVKREQALDEKSNRVKTKEEKLEVKLNTLMKKEIAMNAEDQKLETESQKMLADRENLHSLLEVVDKLKPEITHLEQQVDDERKNLGLVREERSKYKHLQLELKQEIGKYRVQKELLLKEGNNLKHDREVFEKEWVLLDEKRIEVSKEVRGLDEEREKVETLRHAAHEQLKRENDLLQDHVQKELDDLKLQKELFAAKSKHDHLALCEKAESEHKIMIRDFEVQRNNLDAQLRDHNEGHKMWQERNKALEEEKGREKINIQCLKNIVLREREDLTPERYHIEKEKNMVILDRKQLKADQIEINKDIDNLDKLSKKLNDQRKCLIQERGDFLKLFEKFKNCENCGGKAEEFILNDIQLHEIEDQAAICLPLMADGLFKNSRGNLPAPNVKSGGEMSWLRKCTSKIFNLSPGKRLVDVSEIPLESSLEQVKSEVQVQGPSVLVNDGARWLGPKITCVINSKTIDLPGNVSNNEIGEMDNESFRSTDGGSFLSSGKDKVPEVSQLSELRTAPGKGKERRKHNFGLHRTRSVKDVVEDAKVFLAETPESPLPEKKDGNKARKRQHAQTFSVTENEQDPGNGENFSDSVRDGGGRKRRQTMTPRTTPGQTRYNLRHTRPQPLIEKTNVGEKDKDGCTKSMVQEQNDVPIQSPDVPDKDAQTLDMVATIVVTAVEDNMERRKELTEEEEAEEMSIQEEYDELEQIDDPPSLSKKIWTFFTT